MNRADPAPISTAPSGREQAAIAWRGAALVFVTMLVYANTLRAPFVYDDVQAITENESIRDAWPLSRVLLPQAEGGLTVSGRPVLNLSFALNYAISGTAEWSYHVFNILIHTGAGLLLFGIVRRTLQRRTASFGPRAGVAMARRLEGGAVHVAFVIAGLWLLHPLQTQAVTYTVQRAESLMGFFYLLTLYAFVRATERLDSFRWLGLSVAACVLGMATKEVMATAPLLVLLYDRTFIAGCVRDAWRARRGYYCALAATWLLLAALVASTGGNRGGTVGVGTGVPLWAYPLTQCKAVATYVARSLWPHPLVFEYGTFWVRHAAEVLPYLLVVGPLVILTVVALVRAPALGFLGAWFLVILAPTSLAPGTIQMIVEHRMYLPLAAVATVVVIAAHAVGGRRGMIAMGLAALAVGLIAHRRNDDYRSHLALWSDTVAKRPLNARAREGLAEAYAEAGQHDSAVREYAEAARLQPEEWKTHFNLARALADAGRFAEAAERYAEVLRKNPAEPRAHNNLAIALMALGKTDAAMEHYAAAERLASHEPEFFYNHGLALARIGRQREALEKFEQARRRKPASLALNLTLGDAFAAAREPAKAADSYEAALRRDPGHAAAHFGIANALFDLERVTDAIPHYEIAVRLRPAHAEAHHNLGVAYARQERWDEARREFEAALRLKPDYADAQRSREQLRRVIGR